MRISDWSSDVCSSDLQAAPGIVDKQFTQMREFLAATSDLEATRTFRENFAESLLARALNQHNGAVHGPGLAMQIAADSGDPDMAARVFNDVLEANGGSDATRAKLLDAIGQSSIGLRNSQGVVDGLVNPPPTLIDPGGATEDGPVGKKWG